MTESKQLQRVVKRMEDLHKALSDMAPRHVSNAQVFHEFSGLLLKLEEAREATGCGLTMAEVSMLRNHRKIDAIKSVRERTGLALAEAKTMVENAAHALKL